MVMKVTPDLRALTSLVEIAKRADFDDFSQLVGDAVRILSREGGLAGKLQTTGRLVTMQPTGHAIIVGDIHGDLESLVYVLKDSGFVKRAQGGEDVYTIFLGDYGDRGFHSPEVYYIVLKLKALFPEKVVLLRGNHEGPDDLLPHPHDLLAHLRRKFGRRGSDAYMKLRELFRYLYNAVLVRDRCVMLHGGVPSGVSTLDDLAYAHEKHPMETHLQEILWSDPYEGIKGTNPSPRGAGMLFGESITGNFLSMLGVKLLIRGHEPTDNGFRINHNGKILTLFSRKGAPYHNSQGAYLRMNLSDEVENAWQLKEFLRLF